MPYIKQELRTELEPALTELTKKIKELCKDKTDFIGILNYCCTRLAIGAMPEKRYWSIAGVTAALRNAAEEFYRKVGVPYEEKQTKINGDVYPD